MGLRVGALTRSWAWRASRAELRRCALGWTEGGKREWAARLGCPRLGRAGRNGLDWSVGTGWAREKKGSWAKRVGLGFFLLGSYFPFLFYSISKTNKHV